MISLHQAALCALALTLPLAAATGSFVPYHLTRVGVTRSQMTTLQAQQELGAQLSRNATIIGPSSPGWANATERWDTYASPIIQFVVEPGVESDVSKIVKWANANSIPFVAKNRGHGMTSTLGSFDGIEINLSSLGNIEIQPDGETAWFQGGTYDGQVIDYLWDRGYVATTGSCACVGMMGPGLGGGHGRYQGLYGLISDNLVNLNVVLADGSEVRVNATTHSDLWWAMQGAGHNFGIVTSFELKIHPKNLDTWHYHNYVFKQDKLEQFFEALNIFHNDGNTPVLMGLNMGGFLLDTTINDTEPIITWSFGYAGPADDAEALLQPFNDLEPFSEETGDVPYTGVATAMGTGIDDPTCVPGHTIIQSTSGLKVYNVTAERQIYTLLSDIISKYPDLSTAQVFHEGYSTAAVTNVNANDSAVPYRDYFHLTYFDVKLPTNTTTALKTLSRQYANETRDLWEKGAPGLLPSNYVNYAFGDEPIESIYGYEPWRLEKLRSLKQKYDPLNQFRYYNPFV